MTARINRLYHSLVLRHVQGDLSWVGSPEVQTTCECGKVWTIRNG